MATPNLYDLIKEGNKCFVCKIIQTNIVFGLGIYYTNNLFINYYTFTPTNRRYYSAVSCLLALIGGIQIKMAKDIYSSQKFEYENMITFTRRQIKFFLLPREKKNLMVIKFMQEKQRLDKIKNSKNNMDI